MPTKLPCLSLLHTEAGDVAPVSLTDPTLLTDPGLTPDSQTEVGEEVRASGDTRSTQDSSSRGPYDTEKNFSSTNSDNRIISSTEDMLTFDSRISSNSLSGEGRGEMEKEMSKGTIPAKQTTVIEAKLRPEWASETKTRPEGGEKSVEVAHGDRDGVESCGRGRNEVPSSISSKSSKLQPPAPKSREPMKTDAELERETVAGEFDVAAQQEGRAEERGQSQDKRNTEYCRE